MKLSKREFKTIILLLSTILFVIFFFIFFTQDVKAISIPLTTKEKAGVNRNSEPVTSGIPFPKGMLFSDQNLSIQGADAQFQTLTKWDDGSIKWLLVDFQANVPANGEKIYYLIDGNGNVQNSPLQSTESNENITVITGPLKVIISKCNFNLFEQVWIDKNNDKSFNDDEKIVSQQSRNELVITDEYGKKYYSSCGTPSSVVIEEKGPMRMVVKIKGKHRASDNTSFLEYTIRIHFYAHKTFVKVFYTLENNRSNGYGGDGKKYTANFTSFYINQGINLSGSKTVSFEGYSDSFYNSVSYELNQYWKGWINKYEQSENFEYVIKKNSGTVTTGVRTNGYTDLSDNKWGLTVGIRDFWQNFPKKMKVDGNGIQIGLWPEDVPSYLIYWSQHQDDGHLTSCQQMRWFLNGGKHKTYEMLFYFHLAGAEMAKSAELVKGLNFPLFAKAPASWFANSGALGHPFVEKRDWNNLHNRSLSAVFNRYERMQSSKWNPHEVDPQPENERITLDRLRERGGTFGGRQDYGWGNFGDISWANGHSSLHYDWPYGMLFQFVRTDEYEFLHLGAQMTKHRYDIDQYHTKEDSDTFNYGQEFEKGSHHTDYYKPRPSHTWVQGLLLYYVLTGDRKALEAAKENGEFYINNFGEHGEWDGYWGIRIPGWTIAGLTEIYQYTGEQRYLNFAGNLIVNGVLFREQEWGGHGYVLNPGMSPPQCSPWEHGLTVNGIAKYYFETNKADNRIRELIIRMVDWLETTIAGGKGAPESYTPYSATSEWKPGQTDLGGNIFHLSFYIDPFAWAYLITQHTKYLNVARKLFEDLINYYEWEQGTTVNKNNPDDLSVISMRSFKFPDTESKIHSSFLRNMAIYMFAEATSSFTEENVITDEQFNPYPYPNPAKEKVTFTRLTPNSKIRVFNILGELVWEGRSLDGKDVSWILFNKKISSDIYLYVITNDKGKIKRGKIAVIK